MKKLFFFASAMVAAMVLNAQTITIDGDDADWATVPMVTEPGSPRVLKFLLNNQNGANIGDGNAFAVALHDSADVANGKAFCIYVDADKSTTTGSEAWFCPKMKYDYQMTQWVTGSSYAVSGRVAELSVASAGFETIPFAGSFYAWMNFNWGDDFYIPTDPVTEGWKWSETNYQPLDIRPYTYEDISGKHLFKNTWSRHQCVALGDTMNCYLSGAADTAFWCAWAVEVKNGTTFAVSADMVGTNTASCDLFLVDVATNAIVSSFTPENKWAPTGETELGSWDLTGVTPGKYMLKMKNHVDWSDMSLISVTLTDKQSTGMFDIKASQKSVKIMRGNDIVIERNGAYFNILSVQL